MISVHSASRRAILSHFLALLPVSILRHRVYQQRVRWEYLRELITTELKH